MIDFLAGIGLFCIVAGLLFGQFSTGSGRVYYTGPFYSKAK